MFIFKSVYIQVLFPLKITISKSMSSFAVTVSTTVKCLFSLLVLSMLWHYFFFYCLLLLEIQIHSGFVHIDHKIVIKFIIFVHYLPNLEAGPCDEMFLCKVKDCDIS